MPDRTTKTRSQKKKDDRKKNFPVPHTAIGLCDDRQANIFVKWRLIDSRGSSSVDQKKIRFFCVCSGAVCYRDETKLVLLIITDESWTCHTATSPLSIEDFLRLYDSMSLTWDLIECFAVLHIILGNICEGSRARCHETVWRLLRMNEMRFHSPVLFFSLKTADQKNCNHVTRTSPIGNRMTGKELSRELRTMLIIFFSIVRDSHFIARDGWFIISSAHVCAVFWKNISDKRGN